MSDKSIVVKGLHKSFRLPTEKPNGIKQALINLSRGKRGYTTQKVLQGVDFEVKKGEFFGIVGRNGSGKSTLLKVLAQIYEPEKGSVEVNGSLVPFIELGVGFNPELTGRENVYMNGALLGFSNEDVDKMYDEIVDFAELRKFMDQKLKNYSSGMQVRLAFSIAIRAESDILILDEVLAVGDEAFQRKCYAYFAKLKKEKKTVILVTHSMDAVQQFCSRALLLSQGKIINIGNPAKVAQEYRDLNRSPVTSIVPGSTSINGINITVKNAHNSKKRTFDIKITSETDIKDIVITFVINRDNGEMVYRWVTDEKVSNKISLSSSQDTKINLELDDVFPNGTFDVQIGVKSRDRSTEYIVVDSACSFEVVNSGSYSNDIYWKPNEKHKITTI